MAALTRVLKGCVKAADKGMEQCGGFLGEGVLGAGGSGSCDGDAVLGRGVK